jgi:hypothetical protein
MSKESVFHVSEILRPQIQRKDTKFSFAIPPIVKVVVTLYKLCQGTLLLVYFEQFAIGKSIVCVALCDIIRAINIEFREQMKFLSGNHLLDVMCEFKH